MRRHAITVLSLMFLSVNLPHGFSEEVYLNEQKIQELIENQDSSVILSQDETIVQLNPEKLIASEEGLFLRSEKGEHIRLPMVFSNQTGCYALRQSNKDNDNIWFVHKCENCGKRFTLSPFNAGKCPHCGHQN